MSRTLAAAMMGLTLPFFLTIIHVYVYLRFKEKFLGFWAVSWLILFVRAVLIILALVTGKDYLITLTDYSGSLGSGILLVLGILIFLDRKTPHLFTACSVLSCVWMALALTLGFGFLTTCIPIFAFLSIIHIWAGALVLRSEKPAHAAKHIAGWSLILWGLHKLDYPFLKPSETLAPYGYFISILLFLFLAAALLLMYVETIKEALVKSEEKYRSLVCRIPDRVWTADATGRMAYSSIGTRKTCPWPVENDTMPDYDHKFTAIHPDDLEHFKTAWTSFFSNQHPLNVEYRIKGPESTWIWMHDKALATYPVNGIMHADGISSEITFRKQAEKEREDLIEQLNEKIADIKTLSGLIPICSSCKKIRDDKGYWNRIESYIQKHSEARFSHGICPDCSKKLYPEFQD